MKRSFRKTERGPRDECRRLARLGEMKRPFQKVERGTNRGAFRVSVLLSAVAVVTGVYLCVPGVKSFVQGAIDSGYDASELRHFVMSYEAYAPPIILLLTVLQGVITILPLCMVMMVSAMVLGLFRGVVVSVVSQVIAGYLIMRLTRYLSRPFSQKLRASKGFIATTNAIERYGRWGVLVARLIPFGSFDLVNFAAGFLNVRDVNFIIGTLFGVIPATGFYGFIGVRLYNTDWSRSHYCYYVVASLLVLAVIVVCSLAKSKRPLRP